MSRFEIDSYERQKLWVEHFTEMLSRPDPPFDAKDVVNERAALFRKKIDEAAYACAKGDFEHVLNLYDEVVELDPTNHVLYSNRSAIQCKLGRYREAFADAVKSIECKPSWAKAHYRKGHALICMGEYVPALVAFATGLALDPTNKQLAWSLTDAASKCPIREQFFATFNDMKCSGLNRSAFLLISVAGQSLYTAGYVTEAVGVLELAMKV
ncbi:unnamed protein product, partial [Soboliphyme baturini]|uniref:TPR_REGION domain-containing protein n=1 Tax=Soboliphyme baturini TaxID=241478 RepID=A0A183ISJ9_9BILA